jgi:5'-nucleotidase
VSLDVGLEPAGRPHWESAVHLLPDLLELLVAGPPGAVLTLNVPDRPVSALRELRLARLAELGVVQTRVDRVEDGQLYLALVELDRTPEPGSDSALLAAGHPTLTAIDSVSEADSIWLDSALRRIA